MDVKQNFVAELKDFAEKKDADGSSFGFFEGYAATFGNIDRVDDRIEKGAFAESLQNGRHIKLLWQHSNPQVIGKILEAKEDNHGLYVKGRINLGTEQGREAYSLIKAKDIYEMSIGFSLKSGDFEFDGDGVRVIKRVELREVSLVTDPANFDAKITEVKHINDAIDKSESLKDIESLLQEKGFSRKQSCGIVSKIKKFSPDGQGDPDESVEITKEQLKQSESDEDAVKIIGEALFSLKQHEIINKLKRY